MLITTYLCSCFIPFMPDAVVFIVLLSNGSSPGVVLLTSPGDYLWCPPLGDAFFVARTLTLRCFVLRVDHGPVRSGLRRSRERPVGERWPLGSLLVREDPTGREGWFWHRRAPFHVGMSSNILLVIKAIRTWRSSVVSRFLPPALGSSRRRRNVLAGRRYFAG